MPRMGKWALALTVLLVWFSVLCGCGQESVSSETVPQETQLTTIDGEEMAMSEETDNNALTEISTKCGTIYVPQKYAEEMETSIENGENDCKVTFSAKNGDQAYTLFSLAIGTEDGENVGSLSDENGTQREVYVTVPELEGIDTLPQDEQDRLYAMQEAVNTVIENLK